MFLCGIALRIPFHGVIARFHVGKDGGVHALFHFVGANQFAGAFLFHRVGDERHDGSLRVEHAEVNIRASAAASTVGEGRTEQIGFHHAGHAAQILGERRVAAGSLHHDVSALWNVGCFESRLGVAGELGHHARVEELSFAGVDLKRGSVHESLHLRCVFDAAVARIVHGKLGHRLVTAEFAPLVDVEVQVAFAVGFGIDGEIGVRFEIRLVISHRERVVSGHQALRFENGLSGRERKTAHEVARVAVGDLYVQRSIVEIRATGQFPFHTARRITGGLCTRNSAVGEADPRFRNDKGGDKIQSTVFCSHQIVAGRQIVDEHIFFREVVFHDRGEGQPRGRTCALHSEFNWAGFGGVGHAHVDLTLGHACHRMVDQRHSRCIVLASHLEVRLHLAVAGHFSGRSHILSGSQARERVGEVGVVGRVGLHHRVGILLSGQVIHDLLHTRHLRSLHFHPTRAGTARGNCRGNQVESAHTHVAGQFEGAVVPVRCRGDRRTARFGRGNHRVIAFRQVEERDAFVGARRALRGNHRVGVVALIQVEGRFREIGGTVDPGLHAAARTHARTGRGTARSERNRLRFAQIDSAHAPIVGPVRGAALGGDAYEERLPVHRGGHVYFDGRPR